MKHDAITAADAAKLSVDQIADTIVALATELPAAKLVEVIRQMNDGLTWSTGADRVDQGLDMIVEDLRTEEQQATDPWYMPELPTIGVRPVALNPDAWRL